jgi:cardiolipin synthase
MLHRVADASFVDVRLTGHPPQCLSADCAPTVVETSLVSEILAWHWVAAAAHLAFGVGAAAHAMLYKRDPRAALGWVAVCLFFPFVGPLLYFMFGINRIHTEARKRAPPSRFQLKIAYERGAGCTMAGGRTGVLPGNLQAFTQVSSRVAPQPLTFGNTIQMLKNGEQAYPAMLAAINAARHCVYLTTYLFESDSTGRGFIAALASAVRRGVDVRVLVDGVGELYSWPRATPQLQRAGVRVARFLPPRLVPPAFSVNLRNHRKILAVDGEWGFTGGMNIGARHLLESKAAHATADLHFQVGGPVVAQLATIFAEDWRFATGELLQPVGAAHATAGANYCRCISDGPNEDLDRIALIMMGNISVARHEIMIVTPYFLPSREMIASLQSAALRGVEVSIILPQRSNLRFVDWATRNALWELLQCGVQVYYQPAPFAHTKLFVVDEVYAQVGSANLDPRSLRLNFELNLEILGTESVAPMVEHIRDIRCRARAIGLAEIDGRRLPQRLRDAACWLLSPYL